jgi:hypothetical protein
MHEMRHGGRLILLSGFCSGLACVFNGEMYEDLYTMPETVLGF